MHGFHHHNHHWESLLFGRVHEEEKQWPEKNVMEHVLDIRNDPNSKQGKTAGVPLSPAGARQSLFHFIKGNPELDRKVSPRCCWLFRICPNKSRCTTLFYLLMGFTDLDFMFHAVTCWKVSRFSEVMNSWSFRRFPPPRRSCAIYVCSRSYHSWTRPFQNVPWARGD